ncbi:MAG TPA: fasciclin domain-containing protein [Ferruginibacter sp.]|nr:fasciclin domain-containing protein [Ferruginibacter sp.]HMZ99950.1 fasciclin domain-containing protein [Ferruginibacter sp.]HNL65886.1 fasciclin domain-containing protein [Ferruginibacter sp.]HNN71904.1 fasciclin domain-containing protein [Ferruginibacter sp.]
MKTTFNSLLLAACSVAVIGFSSCKKDDDVVATPAANTITDVVVNTPTFSVLKDAVVKAGLDGTLKGAGPFTVFAPDNAAFAAAGINAGTISALTPDQLKALLLYHTLGDKVLSGSVPAGPNAKVITAGGDSVFVTRKASGVFVNGIPVVKADIGTDNGVIHMLEKALNKPSGNIVATAQTPGSGLDSLVKAIVRANNAPGGDPNLISTLSSATITVFAPTNAAFTQLLAALGTNDINNIPVGTLLAVLRYHVVGGRAFSSDLANGSLPMLAGGNTTVSLTAGGGPSLTGNGNGGNRSNIVATNIMCRNGVVHVIDRVLLP